VEILEISEKFQGNSRNSINYNNNHKRIDPNPGSERCGNFRVISGIQSIIIIMIHISTLTLPLNHVEILEISEKFQGNFRNSINYNNNHKNINPSSYIIIIMID
jgi:hypothetical protein